MLNIIIKAVFTVISKLFSIVFSPFLSAITSLFPSLTIYFSYIDTFLTSSLTYLSCASRLLLFLPSHWEALFGYFLIKYSIYLTSLLIKFSITIYNKFKP